MVGGLTGQPTTCIAVGRRRSPPRRVLNATRAVRPISTSSCALGARHRGPVFQTALGGVTVDGVYGLRTQAAVASHRKRQRSRPLGGVDWPVWLALQRRGHLPSSTARLCCATAARGRGSAPPAGSVGSTPPVVRPDHRGQGQGLPEGEPITQTGVVATAHLDGVGPPRRTLARSLAITVVRCSAFPPAMSRTLPLRAQVRAASWRTAPRSPSREEPLPVGSLSRVASYRSSPGMSYAAPGSRERRPSGDGSPGMLRSSGSRRSSPPRRSPRQAALRCSPCEGGQG